MACVAYSLAKLKTLSSLLKSTMDLFHNGDQIWYSFVLMLVNLSNLASMGKIQKKI